MAYAALPGQLHAPPDQVDPDGLTTCNGEELRTQIAHQTEAQERGEQSEEVTKAEALLQIPEEITKSLTEFSLDPKPLYEHREKVAKAIESLLSF